MMTNPMPTFTSKTAEFIIWQDHTGAVDSAWTTFHEAEPEFTPQINTTVGFLCRETLQDLTVCLTLGELTPEPKEQTLFGWFTILKADILHRSTVPLLSDDDRICEVPMRG